MYIYITDYLKTSPLAQKRLYFQFFVLSFIAIFANTFVHIFAPYYICRFFRFFSDRSIFFVLFPFQPRFFRFKPCFVRLSHFHIATSQSRRIFAAQTN